MLFDTMISTSSQPAVEVNGSIASSVMCGHGGCKSSVLIQFYSISYQQSRNVVFIIR